MTIFFRSFIFILSLLLLLSCDSEGLSFEVSDADYVCCEDSGLCFNECVDFSTVPPEDLQNRRYVLRHVADNKKNLSYVPDIYKDDAEIVTKAVSHDGSSLQYASDRLKDNEAIVSKAVERYGIALSYASENMRDNKNVVMLAVKNKELVLVYASTRLKDDQELAIAAMNKFGGSFKIVSDRLKADKTVIKAAFDNGAPSFYRLNEDQSALVRIDDQNEAHDVNKGDLIEQLSDALKHDEEVILWAIEAYYPEAFQYYQGEDMLGFSKKAVEVANYSRIAEHLPSTLLNQKDAVLALLEAQGTGLANRIAVNPNNNHLCRQAQELKDKELVNSCTNGNQLFLLFIDRNVSNINSTLSLYTYLSDELKADADVINKALSSNGLVIGEVLQSDRHIDLALAQNGFAYTKLMDDFKAQKPMLLKALETNRWASAEFCAGELLYSCNAYSLLNVTPIAPDEEIIKKAMEHSVFEACFAPEELKQDPSFKEYAIAKTSDPVQKQSLLTNCFNEPVPMP